MELSPQSRDAYEWSRGRFCAADPGDMALAQGGRLIRSEPVRIEFKYLGRSVAVSHPGGDLVSADLDGGPTVNERILFYQYLAGRGALPAREPWVSFLDLPGGVHHYDLFRSEGIEPLAQKFGPRPQSLIAAAEPWGGESAGSGAAVRMRVFPKIELLITVFPPSPEFGPRANILFDHNAIVHMPTASLFVLGLEVSRRLLSVQGSQSGG